MPTSDLVDSNARMVNGLGTALAAIGWIGFVSMLAVEVWFIVDLISRDVSIWSEVHALATLELVWVGLLALAGFGHSMRLFAVYARERERT